jgi:hypothetical protein
MRESVLALSLLLTACAGPIQYILPSDRTEQEFYADSSFCAAQAREHHGQQGWIIPAVNQNQYDDCMAWKGWARYVPK